MPKIKKDISTYEINADKFWSWVEKEPNNGCWNWKGGTNTTGYGLFSLNSPSWMYEKTGRTKTQLLAHRVAWYLLRGEIGKDDKTNHLYHYCDNRLCCNPDHMFVGSMYDNVQDMISKGRGFWKNSLLK